MIGAALVKAFLAEHGTDMRRLFSTSTERKRVALRVKLIRRLYAAELSKAEISRLTNIDHATICYWLDDNLRRRKAIARRRTKIHSWWEECAQALEAGA